MSLKKIRNSILALSILFTISCSGEPPQVNEIWWQLNIEENLQNEDRAESLSLFVHGEDEDGFEDLETMYLINDKIQVFWSLESDEWKEFSEQNIKWIGQNGITAPGRGSFPEGNYRVLLIDRGGERSEKSFYLRNSIPSLEEVDRPEVNFNQSSITVETENPLFQIWFYNGEGGLVEKSRSYSPGTYDWNQISRNITRRAVSFALYTEPESGSWGWISRYYYFSQ